MEIKVTKVEIKSAITNEVLVGQEIYELTVPYEIVDGLGNKLVGYRQENYKKADLESLKQKTIDGYEKAIAEIDAKLEAIESVE